jgi:nitrogen-specific signal transduction histidine kinase
MLKGHSSTIVPHAEKVLHEEIMRQSELVATLSHIHDFFDAVPNILLVLNKQRQVIFCNLATVELSKFNDAHSIFGLRPGEIFDCYNSEITGECGASEACDHCGVVLAAISARQGADNVQESRFITKDGQALDFSVWASPIELEGEQFILLMMKDISSEKRRRALERIFFHDINNIAQRFQTMNWLLEKNKPDQLKDIKRKMNLLTQDLIEEIRAQQDLVNAENNELSVQPLSISSLELIKEVAEIYTDNRYAAQSMLTIDGNSQDIIFISDKVLLKRIIGNLVKNALEASDEGQTVEIGCKTAEKQVQFWVHNKAFLEKDVQLQIFHRSFSTKGEGRGLGVYSIKLLTERYLKGKVSFTTSKEHGTTFNLFYPFVFDE